MSWEGMQIKSPHSLCATTVSKLRPLPVTLTVTSSFSMHTRSQVPFQWIRFPQRQVKPHSNLCTAIRVPPPGHNCWLLTAASTVSASITVLLVCAPIMSTSVIRLSMIRGFPVHIPVPRIRLLPPGWKRSRPHIGSYAGYILPLPRHQAPWKS